MSTLRECWREFWQGATRPALTSLLITFCVNGFILIALCVYITPDFLAGPRHRYLMDDPFDSFVPITAKAVASRHLEPPDIVILGDSVTVRCVASEESLAGLITEKLGGLTPSVYDLSADGLVSLEMAALVEQLPAQFDGVLVLGVGPPFLSNDVRDLATDILDSPKIGFSSEVLDTEARAAGVKVPYRTGIYFIDNWRFFLPRLPSLIRNLLITGAQPYGDPFDVPWMKNGKRTESWQQEERDSYLSEVTRLYEPNKQANLAVIERIVARLRARSDASFILLQAPINPLWYNDADGKEFFESYTSDLRQFATEHGMSFLSVTQEARLRPADFLDYGGHIGTFEARERCTQAIASRVAEVMAEKNVILTLSESADPAQR